MGAKLIPLTQGKFAIVDAEDYDWLTRHKWYAIRMKDGLFCAARTPARGRIVLMHRQIMNAPPGSLVDHINQRPLGNRTSNLRLANHSESVMNRRAWGACPYKGVTWYAPDHRWVASLSYAVAGKYKIFSV